MGKRWFPSRPVWRSYCDLNEALFTDGYTASDFIPHNYVVSGEKVLLIDADRVQRLASGAVDDERIMMLHMPQTHLGRAVFDVERRDSNC